ncbi:hypothetical protein QW131_28940 [Roseibium salinum]|nr:hypothetical protein [Roseibium salinum]
MSRAYGLLSATNWKETSVRDLVRLEAEAFDPQRFDMSGPDVRIKPQQGLSLAMVIHELATNASKYGSLSAPEGSVTIQWSVAGGRLSLVWTEKKAVPGWTSRTAMVSASHWSKARSFTD